MSTAVTRDPQASSPATSREAVVETRSLSKVYRDFWGRQKVRALKALDLEIYRGEIFGLLGPNGSGKTTTIKLILGLLFPTTGKALVFGKDATDVQKNEQIGYLPEESYLYKFLNAEETLDFYGRLFDMSAQERRERAARLITMVKLDWAKKRQLREYSKGMTRRIGLAQALINDPELIVLDEPTTGLDLAARHAFMETVRVIARAGTTLVLVTHHIEEIVPEVQRVLLLKAGRILADGPPAAMLTAERLGTLFDVPVALDRVGDYLYARPAAG